MSVPALDNVYPTLSDGDESAVPDYLVGYRKLKITAEPCVGERIFTTLNGYALDLF